MNESRLKSSVILRMVIVAALTLLLLIPTVFVQLLISERSSRRADATAEVSESWGGAQTLIGPILSIPFKEFARDEKGIVSFTIRYAHFLPDHLQIKGSLEPEIRYRGIYEVPLYSSQFVVQGQFSMPDLHKLRLNPDDVLWGDAFLTFGVTDLKGLRDKVNLQWNATGYPSEPGVLSDEVLSTGITFKPHLGKTEGSYAFSFPLSLNGSSEIRFAPMGEITEVVLDSPWGNPSFVGSFLPHTRNINADNFHAEWKVLNLNRNFPQAWIGSRFSVFESTFGTSLYLPVDEYQKTERSVKYALLFIALTFVSFFLSEIMAKTAFHPIQYGLVGIALVLFYVLLLSLSEHIGFNLAYLIGSIGIVSLITVYASWMSSNRKVTSVIFLVLVALYSFLFVTLQLQDYALLLGSLGLFVVLFIVMYLTRKIDWFSINRS
jgi:inner membrane protein